MGVGGGGGGGGGGWGGGLYSDIIREKLTKLGFERNGST